MKKAYTDILQATRDLAAVDLTTSLTAEAQLHLPLRQARVGVCVPGAHGIEGQVARLSSALAHRATSTAPSLAAALQWPPPHRTYDHLTAG
jgi:hypothetical protein